MTDPVKPSVVAPEAPEEKISDQDKHTLDLMILSRKLAIANAEKALAENTASESGYKLALFQLYTKYSLNTATDAIDESGTIKRNAVKPQ